MNMTTTIYLKDCCKAKLKFYTNLTCRLCWHCESCNQYGCDRTLYDQVFRGKMSPGHAPVSVKMKPLVSEFLHHTSDRAHGATEPKRGLDCDVVIMKTGETASVYMREPVTLVVFCDNNDVYFDVHKQRRVNSNTWVCNIGPMTKPLVATITIDNKKLPLIVTE